MEDQTERRSQKRCNLATGVGAEVQRALATVGVSGLVTSTLLTLVILPAIVLLVFRRSALAAT